MSDDTKNHATIGALCASVQFARHALQECHSVALALAIDGVDIGQSDITGAARDKLKEIMPLLLKLPAEGTKHFRGKRTGRPLQ